MNKNSIMAKVNGSGFLSCCSSEEAHALEQKKCNIWLLRGLTGEYQLWSEENGTYKREFIFTEDEVMLPTIKNFFLMYHFISEIRIQGE